MKVICRNIGAAILSVALLGTTGCVSPNGQPNNTGTGALVGGAFGALVGAAAGGRHQGQNALIGALAGAVAGGLVGAAVDQQQRERLQAQYPYTYYKVRNNEAVYAGMPPPPPPPPPGVIVTPPLTPQPGTMYSSSATYYPPPPPAPASPAPTLTLAPGPAPTPAPAAPTTSAPSGGQPQMQQFTLDDIKALTAAGVKPDAINKEIEMSHSRFSASDVAAAQQANPPIDGTVIAYMQSHQG